MDALRDSLGHIRIAAELEQQVAAMASALGFQTFALGYVNPLLSDRSFWVDRMPKFTWDSSAMAARDPVSFEILNATHDKTVVWGQDTYSAAGASDLWEMGESIGIHSGLVHIARPGGKRRMMLSMDRDAAFDGTARQQRAQARKLARFADLVAGTVVSLFDIQTLIENDLTPTELEALRWVFAYGYTEYQVSERLNVSFTHACHILQRATEKIGAGSYLQAAMIAARHGALGAI